MVEEVMKDWFDFSFSIEFMKSRPISKMDRTHVSFKAALEKNQNGTGCLET